MTPTCAGCHELIDPLGLPFEGYDTNGLHRTQENDAPIDTTGALTGTSNDQPVDGPLQLQQALVKSPEVQSCFVDQTLRFALARKLTPADAALRQETLAQFKASGLELRELILHLATSPLILFPWPKEAP